MFSSSHFLSDKSSEVLALTGGKVVGHKCVEGLRLLFR